MRFPNRLATLAAAILLAARPSLGATGSEAPASASEAGSPDGLEELMHGMATTAGVAARFREVKHLALLAEPLELRGTLYFEPPDRLVRITDEPNPSRLLIDGERFAFRNEAGGDEVDLSDNPVARAFVANFLILFNGDLPGLRRRYEPRFESEGPHWTLALRPRELPLSQAIALITLAGTGRRLTEMDLLETGGDRTTTSFERVEVDRRFGAEELERIFAAPSAP